MIGLMRDMGRRAIRRCGLYTLSALEAASGLVRDMVMGDDAALRADMGRARGLSEAVAIVCPRCHASPGCPCVTAGGQPSMRVHSERMQAWKATQAALTSTDPE